MTAEILRLTGLRKRIGAREILAGIDATVEKGKTIAIVGPSGAGKSTLLRCLNYLAPFDAGRIEIAGFTVEPTGAVGGRSALRELRARVGLVFQDLHLFPHLNALDNVTLAPRVVRREAHEVAETEGRALLDRVGLGARIGAFPSELSGGERQRVAIARALAQRPEMLLFDEPTSALDPALRGEVLEVMRKLAEGGMTMLVVTHELQFARDVADEIWRLDGGCLVSRGTPDEVLPRV